MKVKVLNIKGKDTGKTVNLAENIFAISPNDHAIWLDIRSIRANMRQGTHSSKGRSEVSGGGRKPFRQKGTGRARQGTIRAPHHVGGGKVYGPHPHLYHIGINKKVKKLARKSALSYKANKQRITIVEDFNFDKVSTNKLKDILDSLDLKDKKVLILTTENDSNLYLSSRNLYNIEVRQAITFSTYDILNAETLVCQEGVIAKVNEVLGK